MNSSRMNAAIRTTIVNAITNTLLAVLKIAIGIIGNSQALLADGIHSFSDLITDALVLMAAKMGEQEPDLEHPYGHRRIETIGGIIISIVLIAVAVGIAYDAVLHILHATSHTPTWPTIVVAVISILANEGLFRYTLFEGNKVNSDLLRTNAWHNRSDALTSVVVLFAVSGAILGIPHLDAIGAFVIALFILKMGMQLIWRGIQELIDASVDPKTVAAIKDFIVATHGVVAVHQLRTRSHGGNIFVDAHIQVKPDISVSEGHYIGEQVHIGLVRHFDHITDVTVHIDPEDDEVHLPSKNLPTRPQIETILNQAWANLPYFAYIKKIQLHYINGNIQVEMVLPLELLDKHNQQSVYSAFKAAVNQISYLSKVTIFYV